MLKNVVTKRAKRWSFSRKKTDSNLPNQVTIPEISTSVKLVQRLNDISLYSFVRCYCYSEYDSLIIQGKPSSIEVELAWEKLKFDYSDMVGGVKHLNYFRAFQGLILLRMDQEQIKTVRDILKSCYYEPFAKELNMLCESDYDFNPSNWKQYLQDIDDCSESVLRDLRVRIKLQEIEFEALGDEDKSKEVNEDYFYELLIDISDHSKIHLSDKISMFEFTKRVRKMYDFIESVNKTQDGGS